MERERRGESGEGREKTTVQRQSEDIARAQLGGCWGSGRVRAGGRLSLSGRNFSKLDCFPLEFVLTLSSRAKESSLAKTVGVGLGPASYLPLLLPCCPTPLPSLYNTMPSLAVRLLLAQSSLTQVAGTKLMIIIAEVEGAAGVVGGQRITC